MSEKLILALSILGGACFASILFAYRGSRDDYKEFSQSKSFLALLVVIIVALLSSLYAFSEKEWAADLLKVIIGLVGGGAAGAAATSISQSIQGSNNFQAVNAQIEKLNSQIASIEKVSAEKLEQVLNVTTHGFADFREPEHSIVPLGRLTFRYEIGKEVGDIDRAAQLRELARRAQDSRSQSSTIPVVPSYPLVFLEESDCRNKLVNFLQKLNNSGFTIVAAEGWDNINDGIEFYFRVGKQLTV